MSKLKNVIKYSDIIKKYKIIVGKSACNEMSSFTHYLQNQNNKNAHDIYIEGASDFLKRLLTDKSSVEDEIKSLQNIIWDIPFPPVKKASFNFIDLFAGIGGVRIPFHELGGKCVFSCEWDKFAQKNYNANYGEVPFGDIREIDELDIPTFDILLGGFPCQAFSQAGQKLGFDDARGTLFFDVARIIRHHKPKAFLLENVPGLLTHDKGNTFKVIKATLEELDYDIHYQVLKAVEFGVPQNRKRIYIVGFKKEDQIQFDFPIPPMIKTRVGDILENNPDGKYTISDALWEGHQRRKKKNKADGKGFGYGLVTPESKYTNTISARYYKDGSEVLIYQGENINPRKITPREGLKLQGFPMNFKIDVSDSQQYKQVGNSVSVPVIRAIAKEIVKSLGSLI